MAETRIAIIGGGISGLSTALALQNKGIKAEVYEKSLAFNGPDTGIVLSGNAIRSFFSMGVGLALQEYGLSTNQCCLKADSGKVIAAFDYQAPSHIPNYLFIQRSSLHKILTEALIPGSLHLGKKLNEFELEGQMIKLRFDDGKMAESDYLIGCDGGESSIRAKLLPESKLTFSGYACWRGIKECTALNDVPFTETWGPRGRFGITPLPGNKVYWYAFKKLEHGKNMSHWSPIDLLFNFFYYHDPIQEILESTPAENISYNELYVLKQQKRAHFGKVLLMGDSAHASMPSIGQGASQAVEDAAYLAKWMSAKKTVEQAFVKYNRDRQVRTKLVTNKMKIYDQASKIDFPVLCSLRNRLLQMAPASYHNEKLRKVVEIEDNIS